MKTIDEAVNEMQPKIVYGFVPPTPKPEDHILGGFTKMPKLLVMPSKDWASFYPTFESQLRPNYDSSGCTIYASNNAIETYLRGVFNVNFDCSERYPYINAHIRPPGADPVTVLQVQRKYGQIAESRLPVTDTFEEFIKPDPMTADLIAEGKAFAYELKYEQLWEYGANISNEEKRKRINECLAYSPIVVSVSAWKERGGVYIDNGISNNHLTMIGRETPQGFEVFDSYADNAGEATKILSLDHNIEFAARIMLVAKDIDGTTAPIQINVFLKLLTALKNALYALVGNEPVPPVLVVKPTPMPPVVPPEPPPVIVEVAPIDLTIQEIKQLITGTAVLCDVEPELALAVAKAESGFNPKAVNKNKDRVKSTDRGLYQWNDYWHPDITDEMAFDPKIATTLFCNAVKAGKLKTFWSASQKNWSKDLSLTIKNKYNVA